MAEIGVAAAVVRQRAVEGGVAEGEDPPSPADQPVAACRRGATAMPTSGVRVAGHRAVEGGVAEGEDPAVAGDQPVAAAVGGGAMPTMGR